MFIRQVFPMSQQVAAAICDVCATNLLVPRPSEAGGGGGLPGVWLNPPPIIPICISKTRKRTRKVRKQFRFILEPPTPQYLFTSDGLEYS